MVYTIHKTKGERQNPKKTRKKITGTVAQGGSEKNTPAVSKKQKKKRRRERGLTFVKREKLMDQVHGWGGGGGCAVRWLSLGERVCCSKGDVQWYLIRIQGGRESGGRRKRDFGDTKSFRSRLRNGNVVVQMADDQRRCPKA